MELRKFMAKCDNFNQTNTVARSTKSKSKTVFMTVAAALSMLMLIIIQTKTSAMFNDINKDLLSELPESWILGKEKKHEKTENQLLNLMSQAWCNYLQAKEGLDIYCIASRKTAFDKVSKAKSKANANICKVLGLKGISAWEAACNNATYYCLYGLCYDSTSGYDYSDTYRNSFAKSWTNDNYSRTHHNSAYDEMIKGGYVTKNYLSNLIDTLETQTDALKKAKVTFEAEIRETVSNNSSSSKSSSSNFSNSISNNE